MLTLDCGNRATGLQTLTREDFSHDCTFRPCRHAPVQMNSMVGASLLPSEICGLGASSRSSSKAVR